MNAEFWALAFLAALNPTGQQAAPDQCGFGRFTLFGGCFRAPREVRSKVRASYRGPEPGFCRSRHGRSQ
jgi:hypothetical protein